MKDEIKNNTVIPEGSEMNLSVIGKVQKNNIVDVDVRINGSVYTLLQGALLGILDTAFCENGTYDIEGFQRLVFSAAGEVIGHVSDLKQSDLS